MTVKKLFLVLHGMWFHLSGYGWWRCEWVTKHMVVHVYTYILEEAYNKGLFSHQMLLIYQRMFLSLKSSLLMQKHNHTSASGFSGEQCPVDEPKTEDSARLSE